MRYETKTNKEFEAALATYAEGDTIAIVASGIFQVDAGCPQIAIEAPDVLLVARGSSQPHVEAWGSSQPHVEAWGSSQPHVEARESSQPHVEAWGSNQPHVEAKGTVQLSIRGAVSVVAAATVAIVVGGGTPTIEGGGFVQRVDRTTPETWCAYYGVDVCDGHALLYKGVRPDLCAPSHSEFCYPIASTPEAPDWDGGEAECGGGLHFSPTPRHTHEFMDTNATRSARYLACPVRLDEMAVHPDGDYPQKCKAKRVALPLWEVDIDGKPVPGAVVSWPPPSVATASKEM